MAFRAPNYLKSMIPHLRGSSGFATSTTPKLKAYAPTADSAHFHDSKPRGVDKGQYVPVYVAMGMIMLSGTLGVYTGMHQLRWSPNVHVKKSRRETFPELTDPDHVVEEADGFIKKSVLRKVAHIQDRVVILDDPTRGDVLAVPPRADTLKSVGVELKPRVEVEKKPQAERLNSVEAEVVKAA